MSIPSLKSLAELPDVPSPVLALVGVGDAAAEAAREIPGKIAAIDPKTLDPRALEVEIDLRRIRNIDLTKLDPRTIDTAALTATGLQWAAKGQETYEHLVARGEAVISKAREDEWADVTDEAPVAQPPTPKPTAKKATRRTASSDAHDVRASDDDA